jgi:hypothetical protein
LRRQVPQGGAAASHIEVVAGSGERRRENTLPSHPIAYQCSTNAPLAASGTWGVDFAAFGPEGSAGPAAGQGLPALAFCPSPAARGNRPILRARSSRHLSSAGTRPSTGLLRLALPARFNAPRREQDLFPKIRQVLFQVVGGGAGRTPQQGHLHRQCTALAGAACAR